MPGVTKGEVVSKTNPLLFFAYQTDGYLTDVFELRQEVVRLSDGVVVVADAAVDISDSGQRLGVGRYSANFTADDVTPWQYGTHVVIWRYRVASALDPQRIYRQTFEVLDAIRFPEGRMYVGYVDSKTLQDSGQFPGTALNALHDFIDASSRRIEALTGRFFEPRYLASAYDGRSTHALLIDQPIIGIDSVSELGAGPADQLLSIDATALRVYNRHLEGLLSPDDRDNPKLEFVSDLLPGRILEQGEFSEGSKNIAVRGVFGYTDPDGSPVGRTPRDLQRIIGYMAIRELLDPFGQDPSISGKIKSAKTRDQSVTFETGGSNTVLIGAITGDRFVDDILLRYMRPAFVGTP